MIGVHSELILRPVKHRGPDNELRHETHRADDHDLSSAMARAAWSTQIGRALRFNSNARTTHELLDEKVTVFGHGEDVLTCPGPP